MSKHIKLFQSKHGLTADGIIGKMTLAKMRCEFGGLTDAQLAHFLANVHHETGGFEAEIENLNYSALRLRQVFPKYFKTDDTAREYAYKPMNIANRVYANRMGNGSEASGDGWKYRGRGSLQLTGKDNYREFSKFINSDVVNNPDMVTSVYYWESALFYFTRNKLWDKAKGTTQADVKAIRKAINGGYNGLPHVQELFTKYLKMIQG